MDYKIPVVARDLMNPEGEYEAMLVLIAMHFSGIRDKAGKPYVFHLLKVSHWLRTDDLQLMTIALGHDLIEDRGKYITYADLRRMGFSERVIEGIRCLTKVPGESYEEYKEKVKSNRDSVLVKMQDLRHNSDLRRLKGVTQKDIDRMNRYIQFYDELDRVRRSWTTSLN